MSDQIGVQTGEQTGGQTGLSAVAAARIARLRAAKLEEATQAAPATSNPSTTSTLNAPTENPYGQGTNKGIAFELLGKGLSQVDVARTMCVSQGLISQYMAEEEFKEGVQASLNYRSLAKSLRDDKIDSLEDKALSKLGEAMDWVTKPMEILQIARTLNGMVRRGMPQAATGAGEENSTVILELPKFASGNIQVNLQYNTNNEVVEVDGRALLTMPANQLVTQAENRRLISRTELAQLQEGTV